MSKAKNSSSVINWIAGGAMAYFAASAIIGAIKRKRAQGTNGVGKVNPNRNGWTRVMFRKYPNGEIIVLFPDIIENSRGDVLSYMHNGGHAAADYNGVMRSTKPAKPMEYMDVEDELFRDYRYNFLEHAQRR